MNKTEKGERLNRYLDEKTMTWVFPDGSGRMTHEDRVGVYNFARMLKAFDELIEAIKSRL